MTTVDLETIVEKMEHVLDGGSSRAWLERIEIDPIPIEVEPHVLDAFIHIFKSGYALGVRDSMKAVKKAATDG